MEGRIDRDEQGRALHVFPVKVYWEDTDAGGIVYYANYLKFTERARTDLLRGLGINQQSLMMDEGVNFVVRDCRIEYLKPARMDDVLSVQTRLLDMKGATMRMEQGVYREDEVLVKSEVRVACIHRSGKPARFLPQIKDKFATVV
nr:tol-pal system-associated acyl-CoA thioesterase [Sneathiella chinensis]